MGTNEKESLWQRVAHVFAKQFIQNGVYYTRNHTCDRGQIGEKKIASVDKGKCFIGSH